MKFLKFGNKPKRVYVDWAAATPLLPEAKVAMEPFLTTDFANPSAIHKEGQIARSAVEGARKTIARVLEVRPEHITFTSSGTEANNLAILGLIKQLKESGREYEDMEIITTRIEHPSVLKTINHLEILGLSVKFVLVDMEGKIDLANLRSLLSDKTVLVSTTYINSEIGTIQPLRSIRKVLGKFASNNKTKIFFHIDAAQAPLWQNCQFESTGADILTFDAGKFCGPKGVGILVQSKRTKILPILFGGGQEDGLRSGTENVPGIVASAVAFRWAQADFVERSKKTALVRDQLIKELQEEIKGLMINGPTDKNRVANNINISIPGTDTEFLTIVLDKLGYAVSTKSACSVAGSGESSVVKEISQDSQRASSTLRITLGPGTTHKEVSNLTRLIAKQIEKNKV